MGPIYRCLVTGGSLPEPPTWIPPTGDSLPASLQGLPNPPTGDTPLGGSHLQVAPPKQGPPRWVPPKGSSLPYPPTARTLAFHTSVTSKTVLDVIFFKLKLVLIDAIFFSQTIRSERGLVNIYQCRSLE